MFLIPGCDPDCVHVAAGSSPLTVGGSSPLTVRGELNMTVVFPGLSCDMILVVASIGSDGLLGSKLM